MTLPFIVRDVFGYSVEVSEVDGIYYVQGKGLCSYTLFQTAPSSSLYELRYCGSGCLEIYGYVSCISHLYAENLYVPEDATLKCQITARNLWVNGGKVDAEGTRIVVRDALSIYNGGQFVNASEISVFTAIIHNSIILSGPLKMTGGCLQVNAILDANQKSIINEGGTLLLKKGGKVINASTITVRNIIVAEENDSENSDEDSEDDSTDL